MNAGTFGDAIRWMPPLVVSEAEVDHALAAFAQGPRRHPLVDAEAPVSVGRRWLRWRSTG